MSLTAANRLQQMGRGDDSMLVHMTPREVAGLQAIAEMKGGSLTINPETGLPEAGFLKDILPVAATAAAMYFAPGLGASIGSGLGLGTGALAQGVGMGLLAGGVTTLMTGDLKQGLRTGLISGATAGAMAGLSGPSTPEVPTPNVETATPALDAAKAPQTWADMPGAAEGFSPGDLYSTNPATGLDWNQTGSGLAGGMDSPAVNTPKPGLTGNQKLALGLGGAGALSLLGGMKPQGVAVPQDKGMIRPYQYASTMNPPAPGQTSPYFQPMQYGLDGRTTTPMDTSERNYFSQKFNALEPYKAANGGPVPQLQNMPNGGLAAIEGMRDGYGAPQTVDGNIPQMADGGLPSDAMLRQMQQMKFERDMPDDIRDYMRAKRMGLLEGAVIGEEQAKLAGGKMPEFMFAPSASPDLKAMNAMAMLNKDLDEDTNLKLMATGYKNPEKKGIGTYGAGITRKLDKDSDLSAFFEQSPDRSYKAMGARYSKRFGLGGTASATASANESSGPRFTFDPETQKYTQLATAAPSLQNFGGNFAGLGLIGRLMQQGGFDAFSPAPRYTFDPQLQAYKALANGGHLAGPADGHLGDYSDGGRLLKGPGDGVSDSIPATINGKQPARLADGEFVIPARIVSELGNGSTDAGAKRLYEMMDRIQSDRKKTVGKKKVAVNTNAKKHLPA